MIIVIAIVFEDGVGGRQWWGGNSQLTLGCNKLTVTGPLSLHDRDDDIHIMKPYTAQRRDVLIHYSKKIVSASCSLKYEVFSFLSS